MRLRRLIVWTCLSWLATPGIVKAGVIVVDPGGGPGAALLQAALLDAKDGEIVLLRDGQYFLGENEAYQLEGKGLTLCSDEGARGLLLPGLRISNVPAERTVVVRGLTIGPPAYSMSGDGLPGLAIEDCAATVWVEDCTLVGREGLAVGVFLPEYSAPAPGLRAVSSDAVVLQGCTVTGGKGNNGSNLFTLHFERSGANGLEAIDSSVVLDHCTVTGGNEGNPKFPFPPAPPFPQQGGGDGMQVQGSFVHCTGSTITGGGNSSNDWPDDFAGDGVEVLDAASLVQQRDATFLAGTLVDQGVAGQALVAPAGTVIAMPAPARAFTVSSPLREGQLGTMAYDGEPGDLVLLLVSLQAGFAPLPSRQGVAVAGLNPLLFLLGLGQADGAGQLTIPFVMPAIPSGVDGLTIEMQAAAKGGPGGATLEAASALVWLDASL